MYNARDRSGIPALFGKVITTDVYTPKGVAINVHQNLVVVDGNAHNFVKIFKFK